MAQESVLVLGSGPIRIGQGIEFDYSCVHCVWSLEDLGYRAVILNNNPETVSTDFDTGDALYFEPVTLEDALKVVESESAMGVVCQFGGQTAINLAQGLTNAGVKVLGTSAESIALAEDREQFDALLESLQLARPKGRAVRSLKEALVVADEVGYPVLVRPSFVLGGRAMEIVFSADHLRNFYSEAEEANPGQPVLVDKYLLGKEAEVDVISDGEATLVPGIMEHIERAGVHSGDSMAVYPPVSLSIQVQRDMVLAACDIARRIGVRGLMNIQFVIANEAGIERAYVLEVNPRASRTVPYLSKVTGVAMVDLATRCMMGAKLSELGFGSGLWALKGRSVEADPIGEVIPEPAIRRGDFTLPDPILYAVKAPVFSFQKLRKVEPKLGPEMKSTGEILGIDRTYPAALYKALVASGIQFKGDGYVVLTVKDEDKESAIEIARGLVASGKRLASTPGTAQALAAAGIPCATFQKLQHGSPNLLELIQSGEVSLMLNTPSLDETSESEAAEIRRACIETGVPCVTSIDTAGAILAALEVFSDPGRASCLTLEEYLAKP